MMKSIFILTFLAPILFFSCRKANNLTPDIPGEDSTNNLFVFAASENGNLYAFNAADGAVIWTFPLNKSGVQTAQLSSPAYADTIIYIGSTDQNIYAINALTGKEVWHYPTNSTNGYFYSSPVVAGGVVYVGGYETRFFALEAKTGNLIWKRDFPREFESSPSFYNGTIFTTCTDGVLYALNATDGSIQWSVGSVGYDWGFDYGHSSPAVKDGVVYPLVNDIAGSTAILNELNAVDGTAYHGVWASFHVQSSMAYLSSPVIDDSIIYFAGTDSSLYSVKTGDYMFNNKQWSFKTGNTIYSSPAFDSTTVYVGCNDGILYAVNKFTGTLKWTFNSSSMIVSSPVVVNGVLFLGSHNRFFAVDAETGELKWQTPGYIPFSSSPCVVTKNGIAHHGGISGMKN